MKGFTSANKITSLLKYILLAYKNDYVHNDNLYNKNGSTVSALSMIINNIINSFVSYDTYDIHYAS